MSKFEFTESDATPMGESRPFIPPVYEDESLVSSGSYSDLATLEETFAEVKRFVENPEQIADSREYPRSGSDPGLVVIFNQQNFDGEEYRKRTGTNRDVNEMILTFGRLGFNVSKEHVHTDLARNGIIKVLDDLSRQDHSDRNCLIIAVLTHGEENGVLKASDGQISTNEIWEPFSMARCPTLKNKPKFFIFQACKGSDFSKHNATTKEIIPTSIYSTHMEPDLLIAFAAVEGTQSYRHLFNGTWFIQEMCRNFMAFGRRDDVVSLLVRTTKCVANNYYHISGEGSYTEADSRVQIKKQMPLFVSTLTKKFYLGKSKDRHLLLHMLKKQNEILNTLHDVQKKVDVLYGNFQGRRRQKKTIK